jgi:2-oxoglutarate dehydrogenase complex dehydrogenase (E1) component-like enzyme
MKEIRVYRLILGYRNKGHLLAKTNPIRTRKDRGANLELSFFGLSEADMDTTYQAGNLIGLGATSLRNILAHLGEDLCRSCRDRIQIYQRPEKNRLADHGNGKEFFKPDRY